METSYTIDPDDRLVAINGPWDTFAMENRGECAVAEKILGHRLWNFVQGFETQSYLNAIFFFCRNEKEQFETTYRCDSYGEKRLFRMNIEFHDPGVLLVSHRLVSSTQIISPDNVVPIKDWISETRCSVCCKFQINDTWIDPFAVAEVMYFPRSYVVCPECKAVARKQLGSVSTVSALRSRDSV
jgi:hypothetical protein